MYLVCHIQWDIQFKDISTLADPDPDFPVCGWREDDGEDEQCEEQPDATTVSEQPDATTVSEQPDAITVSEQPDATTASEQPDATTASEQPDTITASEQPDATTASDDAAGSKHPPAFLMACIFIGYLLKFFN